MVSRLALAAISPLVTWPVLVGYWSNGVIFTNRYYVYSNTHKLYCTPASAISRDSFVL